MLCGSVSPFFCFSLSAEVSSTFSLVMASFPRRVRSTVWTYFERGNEKHKCKLCPFHFNFSVKSVMLCSLYYFVGAGFSSFLFKAVASFFLFCIVQKLLLVRDIDSAPL